MTQRDIDRSGILNSELTQLRTALQGALQRFGTDEQLRRALIHAEGVVADRLGERRNVLRRNERRNGNR